MNRQRLLRTYAVWAPIYDLLYDRFYRALRRESVFNLSLGHDDRLLLVGAGTGADFGLAAGARAVAVDMSPAMLRRARKKPAARRVQLVRADGERLPFRDLTFDAAILHLALSVTPSPGVLLRDVCRVTCVGGRIGVLDHFAPETGSLATRRALSVLTEVLGARVDLRFEPLLAGLHLAVRKDCWRRCGLYRLLRVERVPAVDGEKA